MSAGPPIAEPAAAGPLPEDEFQRWYGGWAPLDPTSIAAFMDGFDRPWWIVGGWAIEQLVEPLPQPEMKAVAPRLHAELALAPAFLCVRARRA